MSRVNNLLPPSDVHPAELLLETLRFHGGLEPQRLTAAWAAVKTKGLPRLVEFEGCALWLERRLQQLGAGDLLEPGFRTWLARRARDTAARNLLIDAQVDAVLRVLHSAGVPHVLLKGAARRAVADVLPFADARATVDVDVLVPAALAQQAWDRLRRSGYELAKHPRAIRPGHFHLPPLWDRARVAVELHTSTSPLVSPDEDWRRATTGGCEVERDGLRLRVPSATELVWHGLTHSLRNRSDAFRLRFLLDGAAIWASGAAVDWPEIGRRLDSDEIADRRSATAWLRAVAWLTGAVWPFAITGDLAQLDLALALRWRFAVLRMLRPNKPWTTLVVGEGTRSDLGLGLTPGEPQFSVSRRSLHRLGAAAGRAAYSLWQAGWA